MKYWSTRVATALLFAAVQVAGCSSKNTSPLLPPSTDLAQRSPTEITSDARRIVMKVHKLGERLSGDIAQDIDGSVLFSLPGTGFQRLSHSSLTTYPVISDPYGYGATSFGSLAVDRNGTIYEAVQFVRIFYSSPERSTFQAANIYPNGSTAGKFYNPVFNADNPATAGATDRSGSYWTIYNESFVSPTGALVISGGATSTPSTQFVPIPQNYYFIEHVASAITRGPGLNMWVSEYSFYQPQSDHIYEVSAAGVVQSFAIANGTMAAGLATDIHGNVWYTDPGHNEIGQLNSTDGTYREFAIPTASANPDGIALGSDGALWFTENGANKIGRISDHGKIAEYDIPLSGAPTGITGPNFDSSNCQHQPIWFVESSNVLDSDAVVSIDTRP